MKAGDSAVLRYITRDGRPGMTWASRVILDREDLLALYLPTGTAHKRWRAGASGRELADAPWSLNTMRLMFPGRAHSVWLSWHAQDGSFIGYYVNLEEPYRRTPIGFDTNDHTLDIVVTPDLRWSWKDEDALEGQLRDGNYSAELIDEIQREAASVVAAIDSHEPPFSDGWEQWRPDPAWPVPTLPANWNSEPAVQWERRLWAYPHSTDRAKSESG